MLPIAVERIKAKATPSLNDMGGGIGGGRGSFNRLSGIRLNNLSLNGSFSAADRWNWLYHSLGNQRNLILAELRLQGLLKHN